jgi:hypothetical protein
MLGAYKIPVLVVVATVLTSTAIVGVLVATGPKSNAGTLDYGLDTNGNGLYDYLVVRMPYNPEKADYYMVGALLMGDVDMSDCLGNSLYGGYYGGYYGGGITPQPGGMGGPFMPQGYPISIAYSVIFLEPQDNVIKLAFNGKDINRAQADGPYQVVAYVISQSDLYELMPYPGDGSGGLNIPTPWMYTTNSYKYTEFEEVTWAIKFTGTNSDQGLDTNGNGLYDYLRVTSEVQVNQAGGYMVSAMLTKTADPGQDPGGIWRETPPTYPGPNWLYTSYYTQVDLSEGLQTINFDFTGGDIRASEVDGPYDVFLSVYYIGDMYRYNGSGGQGGYLYPTDPYRGGVIIGPGTPLLPGSSGSEGAWDNYGDYGCYTTQGYKHDQFDEAPADIIFTGEFSDRGEDWNGNGLYDELVVDAGVEVFRSGYFEVRGTLSSNDGSQEISYAYDTPYLDVGEQTLTVRFPGYSIAESGQDGPYKAHINVVRIQRPIDPEADYNTTAYTHDQFETGQWNGNRTRAYWLESLDARAGGDVPDIQGSAAVTVRRGDDMLAYVVEDTVTLMVTDQNGNTVFNGTAGFEIPSGGGSAQLSFTFNLPDHGTYVATAYLGPADYPIDVMQVVFQA